MVSGRVMFGAVVGAALVVGVSGCSWSDTEVSVADARPHDIEASVCTAMAGSADLRDDSVRVGTIMIRAESAEQRIESDGFYYDVTGRTEISGEENASYEWTCVVYFDLSGSKVEGEITSFRRDD